MKPYRNVMELFKLLEKTNCRKCGEPTCLAFAAAVFQGRRQLTECPLLDPQIAPDSDSGGGRSDPSQPDQVDSLAELRHRIATRDLGAAARRLGAAFERGRLTLKVLGKDFSVDEKGHLYSDIHIHNWVAVPFLMHVLEGAGLSSLPAGRWVPLRELPNGRTWYRLFGQRCEKPLQQVADTYTELFEDMVDLFAGRQVARHYEADISLVLYPLPLVPLLICYWKADEGMASSLNLFFDERAEDQLPIGSIYSLSAGLVRMFEKIALRHGINSFNRG